MVIKKNVVLKDDICENKEGEKNETIFKLKYILLNKMYNKINS